MTARTPRADPLPVVPRLSLAALDRRPAGGWAGPVVDPRAVRVGIVHLGMGAFARAHPAVFTELASAAADRTDWGIAGVTQRSSSARDILAPQDGLYSVLERGPGAGPLRVVGSLRAVLDAAADPAPVVDLLGDPAVRVVTLTVTEKGYRRGPDGRLDRADPAVCGDLAAAPPKTPVGQLVRGLQRRLGGTQAPLTVLSCDNLVGNGAVLRTLVDDFCAALPAPEGGPLADWIASSVRFPSCVVDRIVPATSARDRAEALAVLGCEDQGVVATEPFRQWVIEDDFAAERPPWEVAGAVLTAQVGPWEQVKLRLLNATHSTLAYLGALRGHVTIAEAVADDELARAAERLMVDDVSPTLVVPDGLDLRGYRDQVLRRFANPALHHRTVQVAADGSQKLPVRLLGTVRDRLGTGAVPQWAALGVAAWMVYVATGHDRLRRPLPLDDPLAGRLRSAAAAGSAGSGSLVRSMLGVREVFGDDLPTHEAFVQVLVEHVERLLSDVGT